jgi:hypothetical protein
MPWALVRQGDGTFTFAPFSWKPRRVGDSRDQPHAARSSAARSATYSSTRTVSASPSTTAWSSRPPAISATSGAAPSSTTSTATPRGLRGHTDVAILDYALPFADGVMLFSRQKQLSLTNGDTGLSAHSLAISAGDELRHGSGVRPPRWAARRTSCRSRAGSSRSRNIPASRVPTRPRRRTSRPTSRT